MAKGSVGHGFNGSAARPTPPVVPVCGGAREAYARRMRIIAIERPVPGVDAAAFTEDVLRDEAGAAWRLYRSGQIRDLYFRADRHDAVLFLEADNVEAGRRIVDQLPLVRERLVDFELIPLEAYPGFERLFAR
jgi:muconolactone delta-isomerase